MSVGLYAFFLKEFLLAVFHVSSEIFQLLGGMNSSNGFAVQQQNLLERIGGAKGSYWKIIN